MIALIDLLLKQLRPKLYLKFNLKQRWPLKVGSSQQSQIKPETNVYWRGFGQNISD